MGGIARPRSIGRDPLRSPLSRAQAAPVSAPTINDVADEMPFTKATHYRIRVWRTWSNDTMFDGMS